MPKDVSEMCDRDKGAFFLLTCGLYCIVTRGGARMPIQVQFIDGLKIMTVESITQWIRSGGYTIPLNLANAALQAILGKNKQYGFLQHADFLRDLALTDQFGRMHGDHPPNALSLVDAHLPPNVPDWILVRNDLQILGEPGSAFTGDGDRKKFCYFNYRIANWSVLVVWPMKYSSKPPKLNRLGWLPQMEFGAQPGSNCPRLGIASANFRYTALNNELIDLSYP